VGDSPLLASFHGLDLEKDGVFAGANDIREAAYLALLGRVPPLSIENADSAYVVFMELFDQSVPPKNVAIIVGGGSKVEPLRDKSAIADGWKESIPNPSRQSSREWPTRRPPSLVAL
jgi:hypothetical protein